MAEGIRCYVSGRVQGVFFRASTREQAQRLGLRGRCRNLPDGRVEVVAFGAPDALAELRQWLWKGPPEAVVRDVQCEPLSEDDLPEALTLFEIK